MKVRSPDGSVWRIRRRWAPWRRRLRGYADLPAFPSLSLGDDVLGMIALVLILLVVVPATIIGVVAILELLVLLLLLPLVLLVRVALGRRWTVDLYQDHRYVGSRDGGSFRGSGDVVRRLAAEVASTGEPGP